MIVLVFLDSLTSAPSYLRHITGELAFIVTGRSSIFGFLIEVLKLLKRREMRSIIKLTRLWFQGRILLTRNPPDHPLCKSFLDRIKPRLALHGMGVIYKKTTIKRCGAGILNAHIGKLPQFRGRSVMEWSIFCGAPTGITVFFIDEGIDTGSPIVYFEPVDLALDEGLARKKMQLFALAPVVYARAIARIDRGEQLQYNNVSYGRRFYEMSDLLRQTIEVKSK